MVPPPPRQPAVSSFKSENAWTPHNQHKNKKKEQEGTADWHRQASSLGGGIYGSGPSMGDQMSISSRGSLTPTTNGRALARIGVQLPCAGSSISEQRSQQSTSNIQHANNVQNQGPRDGVQFVRSVKGREIVRVFTRNISFDDNIVSYNEAVPTNPPNMSTANFKVTLQYKKAMYVIDTPEFILGRQNFKNLFAEDIGHDQRISRKHLKFQVDPRAKRATVMPIGQNLPQMDALTRMNIGTTYQLRDGCIIRLVALNAKLKGSEQVPYNLRVHIEDDDHTTGVGTSNSNNNQAGPSPAQTQSQLTQRSEDLFGDDDDEGSEHVESDDEKEGDDTNLLSDDGKDDVKRFSEDFDDELLPDVSPESSDLGEGWLGYADDFMDCVKSDSEDQPKGLVKGRGREGIKRGDSSSRVPDNDDGTRPKARCTAYEAFSKAMRKDLKTQYRDWSKRQITAELKQRFERLSTAEKARYEIQAKRRKTQQQNEESFSDSDALSRPSKNPTMSSNSLAERMAVLLSDSAQPDSDDDFERLLAARSGRNIHGEITDSSDEDLVVVNRPVTKSNGRVLPADSDDDDDVEMVDADVRVTLVEPSVLW
ncbi:hypothetical protein SeLEV6574_g02796 [Synchytrium endobioticum]|uniref:HMG box domain-containing protein n=1 Tax=Synchytrium endobioticum TaxID=286115 RepID=A0A507D713_9FUNG|nr:hypothetical protein SeLEV6574_g02796 [Synchytrium endobioticum]